LNQAFQNKIIILTVILMPINFLEMDKREKEKDQSKKQNQFKIIKSLISTSRP